MSTIWQPSPIAFISLSLSLKTPRLICNQDECASQWATRFMLGFWLKLLVLSFLKVILPRATFCDQYPRALCNLPLIQLSLHLSLWQCSHLLLFNYMWEDLSWLPLHSLFHESGTLIIQLSRCPLTTLSILYFQTSFSRSLH